MQTNDEVFEMFTAGHRDLLLSAHEALQARIKFTNAGLTSLGANSKDVQRIALDAEKLKAMLDAAHDRDRWTYDPELRSIGGRALVILQDQLATLRKSAIGKGVRDPHDIDDTVEMLKEIGRTLRADLFPLEEKQEDLGLSK